MTESSSRTRLIVAGVVVLGIVAALVGVLVSRGGGSDRPSKGADAGVALKPWKHADDAAQRDVAVDAAHGPALRLAGGETILLTPASDALSLSGWHVVHRKHRVSVVADGHLGAAKARATWTFVDGNPNAYLALHLRGVPAHALAGNIAFGLRLADGELRTLSPTRSADLLPHPVRWHSGDTTLTLSNWSGDALQADPTKHEIALRLWTASRHPGFQACEAAPDKLTVDLDAHLVVTIGQTSSAFRWPFAAGNEALLVPVFDTPAHLADPELARVAARDAERWVLRARTLIYGHSNPQDPRYGNGGLLGHGLGATVVVPQQFAGDPKVAALAKELAGTRVELAARSATAEGPLSASRVLAKPSCAQLVGAKGAPVPATLIADADTGRGRSTLGLARGALAATVLPHAFDGRRSQLLSRGLSTEGLSVLVDTHGARVFAAPLVATRNPLIGAAKESLLDPERDGNWTVAQPLAGSLADMELWHEETPLLVTDLSQATTYLSQMSQVQWWWNGSGQLVVYNPSKHRVRGLTLAFTGTVRPKSGAKKAGAVHTRSVALNDDAALTLLWWDVPPGTHALAVEREGSKLSRPAPVKWTVSAP